MKPGVSGFARCDNSSCRFHTQPLIWNGKPLHVRTQDSTGRAFCPNCYNQLTHKTKGRGNAQ